ncbi:MAG TPA: hypothetical protein VN664_17195 [Burkholderiales bacterium]|nr:hypothetical protein [Burkholderiales bacterium]
MHTQVTQQRSNWPGRIPAVSMILPCATALLLTWGSSSIGGTNDIPAPGAVLSAMLTPAYSKNDEIRSDVAQVSAVANRGICTALGAPALTKPSAESEAGTWCAGEGSEELTEVATFLEWHVQARHLAQSAYQTPLSAKLRPHVNTDDRLTALSVTAALWVAFAR